MDHSNRGGEQGASASDVRDQHVDPEVEDGERGENSDWEVNFK